MKLPNMYTKQWYRSLPTEEQARLRELRDRQGQKKRERINKKIRERKKDVLDNNNQNTRDR